jgi:hypothetical protein
MPEAPITVAIPVIPTRGFGSPPVKPPPGFPHIPAAPMLEQAVASVHAQTLKPSGGISLAADVDKLGAATTRQRALDAVTTEWVSFLDDDDLMYPHHLETHWRILQESGADVAYSWFDGNQPFGIEGERTHRGKVWNPAGPHHITMTITVRTELAKRVGFAPHPDASPDGMYEDWRMILGLNTLGAKFIGTDQLTWHYRVHSGNTSGLATRW